MTDWHPLFGPSYTPKEMLELGVFEGKYINSVKGIPSDWKKLPKVLGPKDKPDPELNKYKIKSRQPLSVWKQNGWTHPKLYPSGWFEWYCLYYLGRRLGEEDVKQINRWRSFVARHQGQINKACSLKDDECRPKQRQGLLQWGWDSSTKFTEEQVEKNAKRMVSLTDSKIAMEMFNLKPTLNLSQW